MRRAPGVRRVRAEFETQGLAAVPVGGGRARAENAPNQPPANRRHWCEGRRRVRRARAGFEGRGLAAVPVGGVRPWPSFKTTHQPKVACNSIG